MTSETLNDLLLYCLSRERDEIREAELKQLSAADWQSLIQLAVRHGVAPLLSALLSSANTCSVSTRLNLPASSAQTLHKAEFANRLRNNGLYRKLGSVLQALRKADIPVIVLKGAHLGELVYKSRAHRIMGDADLLVRKENLSQVEEILQERDYFLSINEEKSWYLENHYHLHYQPTKPAMPIEIHWHLEHPISPIILEIDDLWQRTQPATIAGVNVLVLSPEDLLLHLCIHAGKHALHFLPLRSLCDIAETLQHHQHHLDWHQIVDRIAQWNAQKSAYLTLYLSQELLAVTLPEEILQSIKAAQFDPLIIAKAKEQILTPPNILAPDLSPEFTQLLRKKPLKNKAFHFLTRIFLPPKLLAQEYSLPPDSKWLYLYYPVRLKDLLIRYHRVIWQLLRREQEMVAQVEEVNERVDRRTTLSAWFTER